MAVPQVIEISLEGITKYLDKTPAPPRQGKLLALIMVKCHVDGRVPLDDLKQALHDNQQLITPGNNTPHAAYKRFVHYFQQYEWRRHVAPAESNII